MMEDEISDQEEFWTLISLFFSNKGLVQQQVKSFDEFLNYHIDKMVHDVGTLEFKTEEQYQPNVNTANKLRLTIKFGALSISKPRLVESEGEKLPLRPQEARLRNLSYRGDLFCDLETKMHKMNDFGDWEEEEEMSKPVHVLLGRVPIMLRSSNCHLSAVQHDRELYEAGECPVDAGGYFVINGGEKVLIAQERRAGNIVFVFKRKPPTRYSHIAEIASQMEGGSKMVSTMYVKMMYEKAGASTIVVKLPYVRDEDIPIVAVFRALGVESDKEIMEHICYDLNDKAMCELLLPSLERAQQIPEISNQEKALDFIAKRALGSVASRENRLAYGQGLLVKEMLPHIGIEEDSLRKKAFYLGYITHRLLATVLSRRQDDDRDHLGNKRLDMAGPLLTTLFRNLLRAVVKKMKMKIQKDIDACKQPNITQSVDVDTISAGLKYCLATGNWGTGKHAVAGQAAKTGVSQVLNRLTFSATLSHLRRSIAPIDRNGKVAQPRQLHNTHFGLVCPAETPEGQACGLVKSLSLLSYVSVGYETGGLTDVVAEMGLEPLEELEPSHLGIPTKSKVFINGALVGVIDNAQAVVANLKEMRRESRILEVSIVRDIMEKEIRLSTDYGRMMRPLLIVGDDNRLVMKPSDLSMIRSPDSNATWDGLLQAGFIEYIDAEEEETAMIAMFADDLLRRSDNIYTSRYTHCEIHPAVILGVCASIIPFPDHNQSPRNTYQSAMGKQAMGIYVTNFQLRLDTLAHVLFYPQKPLVTTKAMDYLHFDKLPSGQNACVAIGCYSGYNQEDSVIMNQSAIDRGLFRSCFFRTFVEAVDRQQGNTVELFEKPTRDKVPRPKRGNQEHMDADGLVAPGTRVTDEDKIIGKTFQIAGGRKEDKSITARHNEIGVIDRVMVTINADTGAKLIKVKMRSVRIPQIGDKFSSRHGQKGTCGMTYQQEDMPFQCEGLTPDIIMNPHAVPSRMTVGQLVECTQGKIAAIQGQHADSTPFVRSITVENIAQSLIKCGYHKRGTETFYNGQTGRRLVAPIFFGPTYYQRLKHMVDDKIHSRARGSVQILTRQPLEGRGRDGGLRFGEMERDCMISHGSSQFLKERLFYQSDYYKVHVCDRCGLFCVARLTKNSFECKGCNNKTEVSCIEIPYACKLLFQELMSMMIAPRIMTS